MTYTEKVEWTSSALDVMVGREEPGSNDRAEIDRYIRELDDACAEPSHAQRQVAWSLSELSALSTGHSAIYAIEKIQPSVVRITTHNGYGSGVIVDGSGYIITNHHVINAAETITIALSDGRLFEGDIIISDPIMDLALVSIKASDLPTASLGNSEQLLLGHDVISIGYPLGLPGSATVSKGIVSAFREFNGVTFIQTDAAINPGSSGGALINLQGEVIGINVGKKVDVSYEGISYAVAINDAKTLLTSLTTIPNH